MIVINFLFQVIPKTQLLFLTHNILLSMINMWKFSKVLLMSLMLMVILLHIPHRGDEMTSIICLI